MNRSRAAAAIATSVLVLGAFVAAGGPAAAAPAKKAQTIHFTSTPTDVRYDEDGFYIATATSTSMLPVTIAVDPASAAVCFGSAGPDGSLAVNWSRPGTCTLDATQAGNTTYAAATPVTQFFLVGKDPTELTAAKASKGLLGLTPSAFRATLTHTSRFGPGVVDGPYAGQPISFTVAGKVVCKATTNSSGVATCFHALGYKVSATATSYTATFAGTDFDDAATATGVIG
ncbi:MAG: hypothetical protein JWP74_3075 [Marmoricola sp.]|nr:hypothetical protein [Marmoricola sp.]